MPAAKTDLAAMFAAFLASQGIDVAAAEETPAPKAARSSKSASKTPSKNIGRESTFSVKLVDSIAGNHKVGTVFAYQGKRGTSSWKVTGAAAANRVPAVRVK